MTPGEGVLALGRGHISHILKMHISLKIFFFTPRQMLTKEGSTKITTDPGAGVLVLGRCHISNIVKMHCVFKNLLLWSQA